jgi:hypothetical protein
MMTKGKLWGMKQDALLELADEYKIKYDSKQVNRKEVIEQLMVALAKDGKMDEPVEVSEDGTDTTDIEKKEPWVIMKFHSKEGQPNYVFLGHNGRSLYLPREKLVKIPAYFLNVVHDAVEQRLEMKEMRGGRIRWGITKVPALSYEVIDRGVS